MQKNIVSLPTLKFETMGRKSFFYIILTFLCVMFLGSFSSCSTTQSETKAKASYSKKRTRHQPKWNYTTSQTTTYHIRKHNTRKSRNH